MYVWRGVAQLQGRGGGVVSGEVDVHLISISEPASPVRMVPGPEGRGVYVGVHHPTSLDATVGLAVNNFFHFLPLIYCLGESCGQDSRKLV